MLIGAMREYFRGLKLILLFVIVAFIATSFLYFGSDSLRLGNARSNSLASVNGEEIPPARFQRVQRNYIEYYRRTYQQDITPEMAERLGLTQQVINDLIQEALVLQQAKREGITVSDEELRLRIQSIPAFQEDGRFSRERYLMQLRQIRIEPAEFENEVRREMLRQKMEAMVKDGIKVSGAEVEQVYNARFERVRAAWAQVEIQPLMAQVTVSDADAEAYLKTHEARFSRPERRRIQYVLISPKTLVQAVSEADAEAYYKEHRAEFEKPQRLKASHILVRVPPTGGSEAENKSRAKVEEAIRRAKAGEDFGKLARELSEDTATANQGGDLGFVGKGEMVPQFEEAVFALKKGEISPQPVRTPFGYHAIKVVDVQDGGLQPFREVAARIKERLGAERSEKAAQAKADEARTALLGAKDFVAEAKKLGLEVKEATAARGDGLEGIGRDPQLEDAMFGLAVGGVSPVIRTTGGLTIMRVAEQFPAGVPPFADIKDKVIEAVKRERAQTMAEERAKAFAAGVGTGDFLALARKDKLAAGETPLFSRAEPPKDNEALPGPVLLAALRTPVGGISEPVRAGAGVYVVKTLERLPADPQGFDKVRDQMRSQLLEAKRNEAWARWIKGLYAGATVKVQGETVPVDK
ncbi:MAG TPA: SurA N-terminal domain-containing protein [Candidatus Bathyarchaeia archaeon]|nr:SurA N-terminal domain-containing protein [Candidatus Bathyarchaeia archaeon]